MHMKSCCKELKEQWLDTKLLFLDPYKMRAAFLSLMDPEDLSCQMLVAAEVKENIWKEPAGRVTRGPAAANHTPSLVCRDWGSLCSSELPGLGEQGLLLSAASSSGFGMLLAVCSLGGISCSGHDKQLVSVSSPPFPSELHRWVWEAGGKLVSVSPHLWHFPDLELLALSSHGEKMSDGRIPTVHLKPGPAPGWSRSSCLPPPGNSCTVSNAAITPLTHFLPLFKSVPAGKFQTTNPFFSPHSAAGSPWWLQAQVAPIPPGSPLQGQRAPGASGCVQWPCPVAVAQRDAENGSLFPVSNCWAQAAR